MHLHRHHPHMNVRGLSAMLSLITTSDLFLFVTVEEDREPSKRSMLDKAGGFLTF